MFYGIVAEIDQTGFHIPPPRRLLRDELISKATDLRDTHSENKVSNSGGDSHQKQYFQLKFRRLVPRLPCLWACELRSFFRADVYLRPASDKSRWKVRRLWIAFSNLSPEPRPGVAQRLLGVHAVPAAWITSN